MNTLATTVVGHLGAAESPNFDENTVTPGVIGFIITFLVAAATVLLVLDMVRRIRRTRYRGEIREQIEAEQLAAGQLDGPNADAAKAGGQADAPETPMKDAPPVPPRAKR